MVKLLIKSRGRIIFKHVRQNRVFEEVVSQIQALILRGELQAGDKLPSERQLREMFNVSRGTLREAFRALEQKGLINIKTGVQGGAIVCTIDNKLISESLDLLLRHQKISLRELAESREAIEGFVAAKAARRAKKVDLRHLTNILKSIRNHLDAPEFNWQEVILEDGEFHLSLARIVGNRVFESILDTVYKNINEYFDRFLSKERELQKKNYQNLYKIVEALKKRDSQRAQELMQDHVRYFSRIMEKREQAAKRKDSNAENIDK